MFECVVEIHVWMCCGTFSTSWFQIVSWWCMVWPSADNFHHLCCRDWDCWHGVETTSWYCSRTHPWWLCVWGLYHASDNLFCHRCRCFNQCLVHIVHVNIYCNGQIIVAYQFLLWFSQVLSCIQLPWLLSCDDSLNESLLELLHF